MTYNFDQHNLTDAERRILIRNQIGRQFNVYLEFSSVSVDTLIVKQHIKEVLNRRSVDVLYLPFKYKGIKIVL